MRHAPKTVDTDRTREFHVRWYAAKYVAAFKAVATHPVDTNQFREAVLVFASAARLPPEDVRAFLDVAMTEIART